MAMTLSCCKNKSRDFYRGLGGIFELSLFRMAPIQHLRREWKPIAAKEAKGAKSSHRDFPNRSDAKQNR